MTLRGGKAAFSASGSQGAHRTVEQMSQTLASKEDVPPALLLDAESEWSNSGLVCFRSELMPCRGRCLHIPQAGGCMCTSSHL